VITIGAKEPASARASNDGAAADKTTARDSREIAEGIEPSRRAAANHSVWRMTMAAYTGKREQDIDPGRRRLGDRIKAWLAEVLEKNEQHGGRHVVGGL
jgi:hypothetical protein